MATRNQPTPSKGKGRDMDQVGVSLAVLALKIAEASHELTHLGVAVAGHLERDGRAVERLERGNVSIAVERSPSRVVNS